MKLKFLPDLLGPRMITEIVITRYETGEVNYQFAGQRGPVQPQEIFDLLALVAKEMFKMIQPQGPDQTIEATTPVPVPRPVPQTHLLPQEAPG